MCRPSAVQSGEGCSGRRMRFASARCRAPQVVFHHAIRALLSSCSASLLFIHIAIRSRSRKRTSFLIRPKTFHAPGVNLFVAAEQANKRSNERASERASNLFNNWIRKRRNSTSPRSRSCRRVRACSVFIESKPETAG